MFKTFIAKNFFGQTIGLGIIALIIHAVVLKFIFPGYYSPLYPHHSDFYIPVALANSPDDFFQYKYLGYSRPLGIFFLKLIGHFGVHGAIIVTIINVALNCSLSAWLIRKITNIPFDNLFIFLFSLYCYLLFTQPNFYTFYTQDVFSHLSFFILITGTIVFFRFYTQHKILTNFLYLLFAICAFLCKETYALTALFCALLWLAYHRKNEWRKAAIPFIIISVALIVVFIFNLSIRSIFTDFRKVSATDPYYVNTSPASVFKEMYQYSREGLNAITLLMIGAALFLSVLYYRNKSLKNCLLLVGCIVGAFLSWIPNSLIPNHHHGGYSFNGAYLLYLPVLSLSFISKESKLYFRARLILPGIFLFSPLLNKKQYANQWWVLEQESEQRNLLRSLDVLMKEINPSQKNQTILITGLNTTFFPFHHPLSLGTYANAKDVSFDIATYSTAVVGNRENLVKFIPSSRIKIEDYSSVWMFGLHGVMLKQVAITPEKIDLINQNNFLDLIIHPDSLTVQKLFSVLK